LKSRNPPGGEIPREHRVPREFRQRESPQLLAGEVEPEEIPLILDAAEMRSSVMRRAQF